MTRERRAATQSARHFRSATVGYGRSAAETWSRDMGDAATFWDVDSFDQTFASGKA